MKRPTHKTRTLDYLKQFGSITSLDAFKDLGNTRLSATIFNLREDGYSIKSEDIKVPTRFGVDTTVTKYVLQNEKS